MDQILFRLRVEMLGCGGQVNFTKSNPLTCKCNPQYSTRSFSLTFHLIGGDWGGPNPFPWRRNVGVVGTNGASKFHESNPPTCKCNPQYNTRSFQFDIFFNRGRLGWTKSFSGAEKCLGCWGPVGPANFTISNSPTFKLHVGNYDQFL